VPPLPAHDPQQAESPDWSQYAPAGQPQSSFEQHSELPYGVPVQSQSPYEAPVYSGAQQVYQQPQYGQPTYPGYDPQLQHGYQNAYPAYGQPTPVDLARKSASNSMTMGIIAASVAVLIGWIPFFGLLGVAGGIGLGIPAILQAKRAERNDINATVGKVLGWFAIGFSVLWVITYLCLIMIGSMMGHRTTSV